ncbi:MAG: hypothetical protein A2Z15_00625 [Chloroflexi bacterium RBG_16_50_11]|nr:MAG: hypothetical protein A2Z15_00625 [Chloroflexi bacterium RBG_16_50_11]
MKTIKISEAVWQAIAQRGKFGETEDDVLRREFKLPACLNGDINKVKNRKTLATQRMTSYISNNHLFIGFQNGQPKEWELPDRNNKVRIRAILNEAITFVKNNGASLGQVNAVRKTMTDEGYHLTK